VIAGGQDVVQGAAAFGQQLAHDTGNAAGHPAAGEHVRRDGDVSSRRDPTRDRVLVRSVPESIVDDHHAWPWTIALGHVQQRVDRTVRGVDGDGLHGDQSSLG